MIAGSLFSGVGLLDYGLHLAGFAHAWFCESVAERREILAKRWPGVPIYDDVRTVGAGLARVDLVAGGFPCKGISTAGRREGFGHPETALWREQLRIIRALRPRYVLVENVAMLLTRDDGALAGEVFGGLAESGYRFEWDCFPAVAFGAPHGRDRVFITAVADSAGAGGRGRAPGSVDQAAADSDQGAVGSGRLRRGAGEAAQAASSDAGGPGPQGPGVRESASGDGRGPAADAGRVGRCSRGGLREGEPGGVGRRRSSDGDGEAAADSERRGEPADRGVHRGVARGGDLAGREAVPPGPEVALAANALAGRAGAPADTDDVGLDRLEEGDGQDGGVGVEHGHDADGRGPALEWGGYEPAIRRWEVIVGRPSPLPLVRRVDDGRTRRVERSRLSALGDGVLVQAGWLCGRRIIEHAERVNG